VYVTKVAAKTASKKRSEIGILINASSLSRVNSISSLSNVPMKEAVLKNNFPILFALLSLFCVPARVE
jgi:hypothetical protein